MILGVVPGINARGRLCLQSSSALTFAESEKHERGVENVRLEDHLILNGNPFTVDHVAHVVIKLLPFHFYALLEDSLDVLNGVRVAALRCEVILPLQQLQRGARG
jgi:hypothetical protein